MELKKLAASGTLDPKSHEPAVPGGPLCGRNRLDRPAQRGRPHACFQALSPRGRPAPDQWLDLDGRPRNMVDQAAALLERGFDTLKLKVGALDFEQEMECLQAIRAIAPADKVTLRLDANGGLDDGNVAVPCANSSGWRLLTSTVWSNPCGQDNGKRCSPSVRILPSPLP